jgi:hypothetical protein
VTLIRIPRERVGANEIRIRLHVVVFERDVRAVEAPVDRHMRVPGRADRRAAEARRCGRAAEELLHHPHEALQHLHHLRHDAALLRRRAAEGRKGIGGRKAVGGRRHDCISERIDCALVRYQPDPVVVHSGRTKIALLDLRVHELSPVGVVRSPTATRGPRVKGRTRGGTAKEPGT